MLPLFARRTWGVHGAYMGTPPGLGKSYLATWNFPESMISPLALRI